MRIIDKYLIVVAIILMVVLFGGAVYTRYIQVTADTSNTITLESIKANKIKSAVNTVVDVSQFGSIFFGVIILIRSFYLLTIGKAILSFKDKRMSKNQDSGFNGLEKERVGNEKIIIAKNAKTLFIIAFALFLLVALVEIMKRVAM